MKWDAVIVDLETNGLEPSTSVLQFAGIFIKDGKLQKVVNRYYFPKEELDPEAYLRHRLDEEKIALLRERQGAKYPKWFDEDEELLEELQKLFNSGGWFIGFNTEFDGGFLAQRGLTILRDRAIDVMALYTPVCGIPHYRYGLKFPKLSEAIYCIGFTPRGMHNAVVDAFETYKLFRFYPFHSHQLEHDGPFWDYFLGTEMWKEYPTEFFILKKQLRGEFEDLPPKVVLIEDATEEDKDIKEFNRRGFEVLSDLARVFLERPDVEGVNIDINDSDYPTLVVEFKGRLQLTVVYDEDEGYPSIRVFEVKIGDKTLFEGALDPFRLSENDFEVDVGDDIREVYDELIRFLKTLGG